MFRNLSLFFSNSKPPKFILLLDIDDTLTDYKNSKIQNKTVWIGGLSIWLFCLEALKAAFTDQGSILEIGIATLKTHSDFISSTVEQELKEHLSSQHIYYDTQGWRQKTLFALEPAGKYTGKKSRVSLLEDKAWIGAEAKEAGFGFYSAEDFVALGALPQGEVHQQLAILAMAQALLKHYGLKSSNKISQKIETLDAQLNAFSAKAAASPERSCELTISA